MEANIDFVSLGPDNNFRIKEIRVQYMTGVTSNKARRAQLSFSLLYRHA